MNVSPLITESSISLILFLGVVGVLHLGSTVWAYSHAETHSNDGLLWASIVFTLPVVGLLIYLAIGQGQLE